MAKLSITRALAKAKIVRERIARAGKANIVGVSRGQDSQRIVVGPHLTVEDMERNIKTNKQRIDDLFAFLEDVEAKITEANARNEVTVCGVQMTVAAAIKRKASASVRRGIIDSWKAQVKDASASVERLRNEMERAIDNALSTVYSNDRGRVTEEQAQAVTGPKRAMMEPQLIDPVSINDLIKAREEELENFLNEVDYVLSEFNAKTEIELSATEPA